MDESKPTGVAAGAGSRKKTGAVAAKIRRSGRQRATLRLAGLSAGAVAVLALSGFGGYTLLHNRYTKPNSTADTSNEPEVPSEISDYSADQKAQYYMGQQNYAAAESIYKSELKTATAADDKARLNLLLATINIDDKQYSQAYQYASQAETLARSYQTAKLTAYSAQLSGDKQTAAKYYQLAIERLDKNTSGYNYILSELQASLKEVSG